MSGIPLTERCQRKMGDEVGGTTLAEKGPQLLRGENYSIKNKELRDESMQFEKEGKTTPQSRLTTAEVTSKSAEKLGPKARLFDREKKKGQ